MLKYSLKIFAFILIFLLFFTPFVHASEANSSDIVPISEPISTNLESSSEYRENDVYLFGNDIVIDYIIDGNLFVVANNVTINSEIGGDAFICANNITIGEYGYIYNNLFCVSSRLNIIGVSYNVYAFSNTVDISGYIYKDLRVSCDSLNISGVVHRNAFVTTNSMNFSETNDNEGMNSLNYINGNLSYSSEHELNIPKEKISGEINYNQLSPFSLSIQDILISIGTIIATVVLIWLFLLWFAPNFEKNSSIVFTKNILPILGFGLLGLVLIPIAILILLLLGITSTIALLLLSVYCIIIAISFSLFVIIANNFVCNKLKISKTIGVFGTLIITSAIIALLSFVPYLGVVINLIAVVISMGYLIKTIIKKK